MEYKPIESRNLWCPTSSLSQGKLECWVDMLPLDIAKAKVPRHISPPKPEVFEFRMILWSAVDINFRHEKETYDPLTRTKEAVLKDFYMRATMRNGNVRDAKLGRLPTGWRPSMLTDTHFGVDSDNNNSEGEWTTFENDKRQQKSKRLGNGDIPMEVTGGEANFNWRFNWRVELPCSDPTIRIQLFDKVLPNGNFNFKDQNERRKKREKGYAIDAETDHWAEGLIDVGDIMRAAQRSGKSVSYEKWTKAEDEETRTKSPAGKISNTTDPFRVKLFHRHYADVQGYAYVSLECLPIAFANSKRAGQGRSHPNNETVGKLETPGAECYGGLKSRWCQGVQAWFRNLYSRRRTTIILALIVFILILIVIPVLEDSF